MSDTTELLQGTLDRKAKDYRLTPAGRRRLTEETAYFWRFAEAIGFALEAVSEDV